MPQSRQDAAARLRSLRDELELSLLANAEFRAFRAVDRALKDVEDEATESLPRVHIKKRSVGRPAGSPTRVGRVIQVLESAGHPLGLADLVSRLEAMGDRTKSKNPTLSLSALLSSNKRFRSVSYHDRRSWWFTDRPVTGTS